MILSEIQLGKNKITDNFIQTLKNHFKKSQNVRISVLKSARENKDDIKKFSKEILEKLGNKYTARVIGFKIVLKKWRRNIRG